MSMTTLLGLSFGVFPCLLFGFMMLLSLLVCEYIEEYVAKHLCAWKNRRRRGLRSFYHDFRERRNPPNVGAIQHYSSRTRSYSAAAWVGGASGGGSDGPGEMMLVPEGSVPFPASAPPSERSEYYGAQLTTYNAISPLHLANDPPPSYEECVLPRVRLNNPNDNTNANTNGNTVTTPPKKPSMKKSSSTEKEK
ncbi:unnamed protein product [Orchesella dallaii]|uniref:Uncharacterized protein n=1 Tax=Orchesella dallaii TaxID=48710 RepID=A0ABP1QDI4_9HEXA